MNAPKKVAPREGRDRRRWSRYAVTADFPTALVTEDGRIACRIENVSLGGAKLRLSQPVPPGGCVRLDYGGQSGPGGRCSWATANSVGVTFEFSERSVALALACIRPTFPNAARPNKAN